MPRMTPDEIALAEDLLDRGLSMREVERRLGRTRNSMKARFAGRGWTKAEGGIARGYLKARAGE